MTDGNNKLPRKPPAAHLIQGANSKPAAFNVNFVNPFILATKKTLENQGKTKVEVGKPFVKAKDRDVEIAIAGIINLTSRAFQGSIVLCFSEKVFLTISSNMLGERCLSITRETEEAAGEILNLIFGHAKTELSRDESYQIQTAQPTIVRGNDLRVRRLQKSNTIILPFDSDAGPFHIEVSADATI